jgi:ribulose-phosphate 3-epimerase
MMCADLLNLQRDLTDLASGGVDFLHMDIMDGHYVPNFTLGIDLCKAMVRGSNIPLDIHLMVEDVDKHVATYASIENARVSFHPETSRHPLATLQNIRQCGAEAGIAIDPSVPVDGLKYLLSEVQQVCVMTVNPGFAGQKLIASCLGKISELRDYREKHGLDFDIEVDGNVSWANIPKMIECGANVLVAGTSSLFHKEAPLKDQIQRMKGMVTPALSIA